MTTHYTPFLLRFTPKQMDALAAAAAARQRAKHGPDGKQDDRASGEAVHLRGLAGHAALALLLGVRPDLSAEAYGTRGISLRAAGLRFHVQHNSRPTGDLRFNPGFVERLRDRGTPPPMPPGHAPATGEAAFRMDVRGGVPSASLFVLTTGTLPDVEIVGCATWQDVAYHVAEGGRRRVRTLPGKGDRWIVEQARLRSVDELLRLCHLAAPASRALDIHRELLQERADTALALVPPPPVQGSLFGDGAFGTADALRLG